MSQICVGCSGPLPYQARPRNPRKWCSGACRVRALRGHVRVSRSCAGCGTNFETARASRTYCTPRCRWLHQTTLKPKRIVSCLACGMDLPDASPMGSKTRCLDCRAAWRRDYNRRKNLQRRVASIRPALYELQDIGDRQQWSCGLCGQSVHRSLSGMDPLGPTIDHLIPLSLGGLDTPDNVQVAHRRCNTSRGNRPIPVAA